MDVAAPLTQPASDVSSGVGRSKIIRPLLAVGLALTLGVGGAVAWPRVTARPDSAQSGADVVVGRATEPVDVAPDRDAVVRTATDDQPQARAGELAPGIGPTGESQSTTAQGGPEVAASAPATGSAVASPPAPEPVVASPANLGAAAIVPGPGDTPSRPEPLPAIAPPKSGPPIVPLAVMIENAPEARPQSGLLTADVVYEALAEGGISRFMAVYFGDEPTTVGPVRSARHYFVNLASELGASLVHVGASPLGYEVLRGSGLRNLDETYAHPGFWRSRARLAPHNTYTTVHVARTTLDGFAAPRPGQWAGFTFKDPGHTYQGPPAPVLSLDYQPWGYRVEYRYDPETKRYARFMEGAAHRDAESGEQIWAANVVVQRVSAWVIDREGRLDMDQVSHGPAAYFVDGVVVTGGWRKETASEPTRFFDEVGNPVRFNPGPIWVQMIPYEGKADY